MNLVCTALLLATSLTIAAQSTPSKTQSKSGVAKTTAITYQERVKKLNPLVAYYNSVDPQLKRIISLYRTYIQPEKGKTGSEQKFEGFPNSDRDLTDAVKTLTTSLQVAIQEPELDKRIQELLTALQELKPLAPQMHEYYKEVRQYELDNFAKGKELHPKLTAAFDKIEAASDALRPFFLQQLDKLAAEELAMIEKKEGKSLRYYVRKTFQAAEKHVKFSVGSQQLDLNEFNASFAAYREAYTTIDTFYRTNISKINNTQKEAWRRLDPRFSGISDVSEGIASALESREKEKRDEEAALKAKKKFYKNTGDSSPEHQLSTAVNNFISAYNGLVSSLNSSGF